MSPQPQDSGGAYGSASVADGVIVLYRVVVTNPPTIDDMRSYQDLGIPLRRTDPGSLRRASGISLFDSLERARTQARRKPWMGNAFIEELVIPVDRFPIEKTASPGHFTAWGDANVMLKYVRRVERV